MRGSQNILVILIFILLFCFISCEKSESDEKRYTGHPSFLRKTKSISPLMDFNGEPDPESEDEPVSEDKEIFEDLQEPGDQPFQLSIFHTDLRWSGILNLI